MGFDQVTAPCEFGEAFPIDGYTESGVEFVSPGVILDECSGLAFDGSSSPNVVAFDATQITASGYPAHGELSFVKNGFYFNRVRIDLNGPPGQTVVLTCSEPWPWFPAPIVSAEIVLDLAPTTLELWTSQYCNACMLTYSGQALVVDNLRLSDQPLPNPVPIDSRASTALFVVSILVGGLLVIRTVSKVA